ncbi:MAG: hypothetical protein ABIO76_02490, partial [Ginsengibacter sp.]
MTNLFPPIIQASQLVNIQQVNNIILIDARTGSDAHRRYLNEHLKGAFFVDLEKQLADIKTDVAEG